MAVLLFVVSFFVFHHFDKGSSGGSPEDQIRAVIQHEANDFNSSKPPYNPDLICKAQVAAYSDEQFVEYQRAIRAKGGTASVSLANIHVTGDSATADVTIKLANISEPITGTDQFVKEDGRWKDCTPPASSGDTGGS